MFNRILPLLTMASIFRQEVVKPVLRHRGLIASDMVRDRPVPVDDQDRKEIDIILSELEDLMQIAPARPEAALP